MRLISTIAMALAALSLNAQPANAQDALRGAQDALRGGVKGDKPSAGHPSKVGADDAGNASPPKDVLPTGKDDSPSIQVNHTAAPKDAAPRDAGGEALAPAPAQPVAPPRPTYAVVARINLATQRMHVTVDGRPAHAWMISSGVSEFPTPRGTFRAQWMSKMWYSQKYDLAPMPHSVFFHGGAAVHGSNSVRMLGQPASHGCVRLAPGNAATFYGLVQKHGLARTQISVFGEPPRARAMARREAPRAPQVGSREHAYRPSHAPEVRYYAVPVQSQAGFWGTPVGQQATYRYIRMR